MSSKIIQLYVYGILPVVIVVVNFSIATSQLYCSQDVGVGVIVDVAVFDGVSGGSPDGVFVGVCVGVSLGGGIVGVLDGVGVGVTDVDDTVGVTVGVSDDVGVGEAKQGPPQGKSALTIAKQSEELFSQI